MARNLFGGSSDDYAVDTYGKPVTNRRVRFYTSAAMTTEITDLASDSAGTGSPLTVSTDAHGFWGPIYGPDAVTVMYAGAVDVNGNPPSYVVAVYTHTTTAGGVASFNTRTGAITLAKADVTGTGLAAVDVGADASGAAATVQTNLTTEVTRAQAAEAALGGGMQFRTAVVVATTNQTLSGLPTVDAVTLTAGQVILLTGQTAGSQNGLWAVASGAWTRPSNFAAGSDATATSVLVESGTAGAGTTYAVTGTSSNVVGTNVLTFVKTSGTAASGSGWPPGVIDATAAPYGAVADGREAYDGATTSGQPTIISATLAPTSADVGKTVVVCSGGGGTVVTSTVASVNAGTNTITLAGNVTFTSSAAIVLIGTDNTAALQAAHNAGGAVGLKSGKYLVAGAQTAGNVTGTGLSAGQTFAYTGQILTPARSYALSMKHYAFIGAEAPPGASIRPVVTGPPVDAAVVILSAATSGNVFSAIPTPAKPGAFYADNVPTSHVHVDFENVAIRTLPGFPIKVIAGSPYSSVRGRRVLIDIAYSGQPLSSVAHASSVAFDSPAAGNEATVQFDGEVLGYGTAFQLTEWGDIKAQVQSCKVGYSFLGGGHVNHVSGLIQHTDTHFKGGSVIAYLKADVGCEIDNIFLSDPSFELRGEIVLHRGDNPEAGLPIDATGGLVNIRTLGTASTYGLLGSAGQAIRDDFSRVVPSTTKMHATSISNHVWFNGLGSPGIGIISGKAQWVSAWGTKACTAPPSNRTVSRATITLAAATGASAGVAIRDGQVSQQTLCALLEKDGSHDQIVLLKNVAGTPTVLASLTTAGLLLGTTYDLSVYYDQPVANGPATVTIYLGGVQKVTFSLSSGDQATFGTPKNAGLATSVNVVQDAGSQWSYYECVPA